jgi:hypothetical protein
METRALVVYVLPGARCCMCADAWQREDPAAADEGVRKARVEAVRVIAFVRVFLAEYPSLGMHAHAYLRLRSLSLVKPDLHKPARPSRRWVRNS